MVVQGFLAWGLWAWVLVVVGWLMLCTLVTAIVVGIRTLRELIQDTRDFKRAAAERSVPRVS